MTEEFFPKRNNVKCGFDSHCKECSKEKEKTRVRIKPFNEKGELYCHHCKTYKPLEEFYPNSSNIKNRNWRRAKRQSQSLFLAVRVLPLLI